MLRKVESGKRKVERPGAARGGVSARDPQSEIPNPKSRSALTLVELLVVISILTTLVAAAIPLMAPSTAERRIREGARQLNTMITGAQARAIELGRPVGIWLEKLSVETGNPADRGAVMNVFYCETPQPFRGFSDTSVVRIRQIKNLENRILHMAGDPIPNCPAPDNRPVPSPIDVEPDRKSLFLGGMVRLEFGYVNNNGAFVAEALPPNMFRIGDLVQIDGRSFRFGEPDSPTGLAVTSLQNVPAYYVDFEREKEHWRRTYCVNNSPRPIQRVNTNMATASGGDIVTFHRPYKILRLPAKSSSSPLQLPDGVVIDLEASGDNSQQGEFYHDPLRPHDSGTGSYRNSNDTQVVVVFGANGDVQTVYRDAGNADVSQLNPISYVPNGAIHLLVAVRENIGESDASTGSGTGTDTNFEDSKVNWLDPNSIWVTINARSGRTTTSENSVPLAANYVPTNPNDEYKRAVFQRQAAREFTQSNFRLGGR